MSRRVLPRARCPKCGNDVADDEIYCDDCQVTCVNCHMPYDPEEVDEETGACDDCYRQEVERARLTKAIQRLQAWAAQEGTRRHVAESLAEESAKYLPQSTQRHVSRWLLVWETAGTRKELRKVVEHLEPYWRKAGKTVTDPATVKDTEANNRQEVG
jgi:hypothetical protein